MDDAALVRQCLNGQSHAFGILVDRYQTPLYNAAFRILKSREAAEDVTQNAFLKAYERLSSYDPAFQFFSWIYRITVNESLNHVKSERRWQPLDADAAYPDMATSSDEIAFEENDRLDRALSTISPEERALLSLKHVEGFSYEEMAFIFDIRPSLVKSRLYTARQRLKEALLEQSVRPNR